jgi:hypothetical protein
MVTPLLWQHEVRVITAATTSDNLTLKVKNIFCFVQSVVLAIIPIQDSLKVGWGPHT